MVFINDAHGQISETQVHSVATISCLEELQSTLKYCAESGLQISVAGGRHSLGRQPFITNGVVLDMRNFNQVLGLEEASGIIRLQGGCMWPDVRRFLDLQENTKDRWEINQKQTGADTLSVAGAISVNAHGNILCSGPISADVAWIKLVTADGCEVFCDRAQNRELFSLAIGGLGLFGVICEIGLQLVPQTSFVRHAKETCIVDALDTWTKNDGRFCYGDMQLNIDSQSPSYLTRGILNLREDTGDCRKPSSVQKADWNQLLALAHFEKRRAYEHYCAHAQQVHGQIEIRDDFQWDFYEPNYHRQLEIEFGLERSSEVLAEFFIPFESAEQLLSSARCTAKRMNIDLILATLRSIKRCDISYLRWARRDYLCLVLAIHTEHDHESLRNTDQFCSALSQFCCDNGGTYYLPYRPFASSEQLRAAFPNFEEFAELKTSYDPMHLLSSDWFEQMCEKTKQPLEGTYP